MDRGHMIRSSKTLVTTQETAWHHNTEDSIYIQTRHNELSEELQECTVDCFGVIRGRLELEGEFFHNLQVIVKKHIQKQTVPTKCIYTYAHKSHINTDILKDFEFKVTNIQNVHQKHQIPH
jgi:hypothetical protein